MRKEFGKAPPRPEGKGGSNGADAAFLAFVLLHAGCRDGVAEYRLDERSLACWCRSCDELRILTATDHHGA